MLSSTCQTNGRVVSVAISDRRGISKTPVPEIQLEPEWGIRDDAHGGGGHRQVSLLAIESIGKARDAGLDVAPGDFAENVATEGLDLRALPVGARLTVGSALTEVTQIGKVCHTPCAIGRALGECVFPLEGIFVRVLSGGTVRPNDSIEVTYPAEISPDETLRLKRELRRMALDRRRSLTLDEAAQSSRAIWERIERMDEFRAARCIAFYVSSKDNEVDTHAAIDRCIERDVEVLVPIVERGRHTMTWSRIRSRDVLEPANFGILEPPPDAREPADPHGADLVVVPGIAFDGACRRIGYGGGYYDRFMAEFDGLAIAPAHEVQMVPRIYPEPHDLSVDRVITKTETLMASSQNRQLNAAQ